MGVLTKERPVRNIRQLSNDELNYVAHGQSYDVGGQEYAKREIERRHKETLGYKLGTAYSKAKEMYNANQRKKESFVKSFYRGKKKKRRGGGGERNLFGEFSDYKINEDFFALPKMRKKSGKRNIFDDPWGW